MTRSVGRQKRHDTCDFPGAAETLHGHHGREVGHRPHRLQRAGRVIVDGREDRPGLTVFTRMPIPVSSTDAVERMNGVRPSKPVTLSSLVDAMPAETCASPLKMTDAPSFRNGSAFHREVRTLGVDGENLVVDLLCHVI